MSDTPNCAAHGSAAPEEPVVVFVADDRMAMALAAAIASVIANLSPGNRAQIFVVDGGVSATNREKVMRSSEGDWGRVEWLWPSDEHRALLQSLPGGFLGTAPYYKLIIAELLDHQYSRAIYLDCDVIVERDLIDLWRADLRGNHVLAAQDLINPLVSSPLGLKNWETLGRKRDDGLFNSGVLVLNTARWRQEDVAKRLLQYLREHDRDIQLCDQDAMNGVFVNSWGKLDRRWNVLPYMHLARNYSALRKAEHEALLQEAYILHFCGPSKPWSFGCSHPRKDRFFHYLDMTAWAGWRPRWWPPDTGVLRYYARRLLARVRKP